MTAEPMKCANCGESIVQMMSRHWYHEFTGFQECRLYAKPMNGITGIKSEDIKPVEGITREEVEGFLNDLHERPALPTNREWLDKDGTEIVVERASGIVGGAFNDSEGVTRWSVILCSEHYQISVGDFINEELAKSSCDTLTAAVIDIGNSKGSLYKSKGIYL